MTSEGRPASARVRAITAPLKPAPAMQMRAIGILLAISFEAMLGRRGFRQVKGAGKCARLW